MYVVFFQSASSVEDKVQTVKVGDGDHQETKNLNNELDLTSSSSGSTVSLAVGAGTANVDSTAVTGEIFNYLELYRGTS